MKNKKIIKINESSLRRLIKEAIENMEPNMVPGYFDNYTYNGEELEDGFYVCRETDEMGEVNTWIGNKEDAKKCAMSSEGTAEGPFATQEEAHDYYLQTTPRPMSDTEDFEDSDNFDDFGVGDENLYESKKLKKIIKESIKEVLGEVF